MVALLPINCEWRHRQPWEGRVSPSELPKHLINCEQKIFYFQNEYLIVFKSNQNKWAIHQDIIQQSKSQPVQTKQAASFQLFILTIKIKLKTFVGTISKVITSVKTNKLTRSFS